MGEPTTGGERVAWHLRATQELDTVYAHIRALIADDLTAAGYRAALFGLLPEATANADRCIADLREHGLGELADLVEARRGDG